MRHSGVVFPICVVAATAICLGYDAGVMSGAIAPLAEELRLDDWEIGITMGSLNLCASIGALAGSSVADLFGRKRAVSVTAAVLTLGPLVVSLSSSFALVLLGRIITGVGIGFAFTIAPLFACEVAPPESRGKLISIIEVNTNAGIVLGYLSSFLLELPWLPAWLGWRLVTGLASLPALFVLVFTAWLPESPRWLCAKGRPREAREVLERLCGAGGAEDALEVDQLLEMIESSLEESRQESGWASIVLCPEPRVRRMLAAGLGAAFFQQASGSEAVVYYTPTILKAIGMESSSNRIASTTAVGMSKFISTFVALAFIDSWGRRPMALLSSLSLTLCLLGLIAALHFGSPALAVALLCAFMGAFQLALAPLPAVLGTECYPLSIRAKALSLGVFVHRALSGTVALVFPVMSAAWGVAGSLWVFAAIGFVGLIWAYLFVPETSGLTLEEVQGLFDVARRSTTLGRPTSLKRRSRGSALKPQVLGRSAKNSFGSSQFGRLPELREDDLEEFTLGADEHQAEEADGNSGLSGKQDSRDSI